MKQKMIRYARRKVMEQRNPRFILAKQEEAMGTLEVVVITGILLTIALLFNTQIRDFATNLFSRVFNDSKVISSILK